MMPTLTSEQLHEPLEAIFAVGSLVYVTSYGPYWGLKGIICTVDVIDTSLYFYLVTLLEGQMKEPIWLVQDDVAAVEGENVDKTRSRLGDESSPLQYDRGQISVAHMQGRCKKSDEKRQEAQDDGMMRLSQRVGTKMTERMEVPVEIDKQQRGQYHQEQFEIDKELIQKQQQILQAHPKHIQDLKSLIELNKEYIENQKQLIQRNRERIAMLKRSTGVLIWRPRKAYTTPQEEPSDVISDGKVTTALETADSSVAVMAC